MQSLRAVTNPMSKSANEISSQIQTNIVRVFHVHVYGVHHVRRSYADQFRLCRWTIFKMDAGIFDCMVLRVSSGDAGGTGGAQDCG